MLDLAEKTIANTIKTYSLGESDEYGVTFCRSVEEIKDEWDALAPEHNLFLQRAYLQVLENYPPIKMRFVYGIVRKGAEPIGIIACQIQYFKAEESINDPAEPENRRDPCFFTAFSRFIKGLVTKRVEYDSLVCGSLLLTGEHGFHFTEKIDDSRLAFDLLQRALKICRMYLDEQQIKISLTLVKDFYEPRQPEAEPLRQAAYNEFKIQPNMIMPLHPDWHNLDDYLGAMSSKYRVRVRRASKKGKDLVGKEFDENTIRENEKILYQLYLNIARDVGFNAVKLHPGYFAGLKESLEDNFRLFTYWVEGRLVAFYTAIYNGDELEAHFLGMDKEANLTHQIYLNILVDLVGLGIEAGVKRIVFARTALEIKSSIGAEPVDLLCYLKHRSSFANRFLNPLLDYLSPDEGDWHQRHPFKKGQKATLVIPPE